MEEIPGSYLVSTLKDCKVPWWPSGEGPGIVTAVAKFQSLAQALPQAISMPPPKKRKKEKEKSQMNNLTLYFKELEKEQGPMLVEGRK